MTIELYTEVLDALTYALHASASRRSPNYTASLIDTRDRFTRLYPEFREAYIPIGDRE